MLGAGIHLNSLHFAGDVNKLNSIWTIGSFVFFRLWDNQNNFSLWRGMQKTSSSDDLIVHVYHHPFSFREKTKHGKPLSTSNGLSHADLVFRNPQVMVRSSTLLPFMPCWTVWGPGFGPRNRRHVKLLNCQPIQLEKTCCKIGHQKLFK